MTNKQLNLEISESLFKELEYLSEITEESIDNLVIQMISRNILSTKRNAETLKEKLDQISDDNIPEMVETGDLTVANYVITKNAKLYNRLA
ncbi:MAG: hypothetical protein QNJ37_06370 [Crocosphaera sp.]|nr:hypothetical protein [Crocosphaera sp.]